jgi:hypothetical protein
MKKLKEPSTFIIGLLFGALVGLIAWYWYKATSAEDGALDLLDRMAAADGRIRELESQQRVAQVDNYITLEPEEDSLPPFLADESDDLQRVNGIGPVFSGRLREAGIGTVAEVTAVSPEKLAAILDISERRAASILTAAKQLT